MKKNKLGWTSLMALFLFLYPISTYASEQSVNIPSTTAYSDRAPAIKTTDSQANNEIDIWMPDKSLQNKVAQTLGFTDVSQITKESIKNLTALQFDTQTGTALSSLKGLEFATNLSFLYIPKSNVSDISPLASCSKLTILYIMNSNVQTINPLKNLTQLTNLHLDKNPFSDYSPIENLPNIEEFGARSSRITSLSFLSNMTNLKRLYLWGNNISDLSDIHSLKNLTTLELSYNDLSDEDLNLSYPQLKQLFLDGNNLTTIQPLSTITSLEYLSLYGNHIQDISPLNNLKNLSTLNVNNQTISLDKVIIKKEPYLQKSTIKSKTNQTIFITPNQQAETGSGKQDTIEWSQLKQEGTLYSSWNDTENNFSGTVVLPYEKQVDATVIVKYVDDAGNQIAESKMLNGHVGETYDVSTDQYKLSIKDYIIDDEKLPANAKGTFSDSPTTITYVYNKQQVIHNRVKYVDENGKEIHVSQSISGRIGESYDATTKDFKLSIEGYTLDEEKLPANAKGTFSDTQETITYVYKENVEPSNSTSSTDTHQSKDSSKKYHPKSDSTTQNMSNKNKNLPKSGEKQSLWLTSLGTVLVLFSALFVFRHRRNS